MGYELTTATWLLLAIPMPLLIILSLVSLSTKRSE